MRFVVVVMFAAFASAPSFAQAQQIPKDQCTILTAADLEPVMGKGAVPTTIGEEECRYKTPVAGYEVHFRRQNGAAELKDWVQFSMVKPVTPVKDLGDEAFLDNRQTAVAFRKGNVAVRVSGSGVMKTAPMTHQQGVVEVAKRIAAKLK